jgi:hypothetical protein
VARDRDGGGAGLARLALGASGYSRRWAESRAAQPARAGRGSKTDSMTPARASESNVGVGGGLSPLVGYSADLKLASANP